VRGWLAVVLLGIACGGGDDAPEMVPDAGADTAREAGGPRDTVRAAEPADTNASDRPSPQAQVPPAVTPPDTTGRAPAPAPAAAADPGADALRRAATAYEDLRAMQADFTMTMRNPILRSTTTSRGTLFQRSPDRLLLRFSEPPGDVIVSDGTYFWVYYPSVDAGQVTRLPAAQAGAGGVDLRAQFVGDPVERFDYVDEGRESVGGRAARALTLRPRFEAGYEALKVWIDEGDALVRSFEIHEQNGSVRRFDLTGLVRNPTLADDLFRFTPPEGARVVERGV
jgi:outer membrane lipoprotein carrier protein